jgi:hypothetical protein
LKEKSHYKILNPNENSDAYLICEIKAYGINSMSLSFLPKKYHPVLLLEATLFKENKIIWKDTFYLNMFTNMPIFLKEEMAKDPTKLVYMWDSAAEYAVNQLISDMNSSLFYVTWIKN